MYKELIKRKLSHLMSTRTSNCAYIQFINVKDKPFVLRSSRTNNIIDSFSNLKDAISKMNSIKNFPLYRLGKIGENKNREIIVHLRMQKGLDKQQLIDYCINKFNLDYQDAERLFFEAYPDGLDLQEEEILNSLECILTNAGNIPISAVNDSFDSLLTINKEYLKKDNINPVMQDNIQIVVASLLKKRNII